EYKKCSPGFLVYLFFVKELIKTGCTTVFLGGAGYTYKRKFGSYERECYTGYLLTNLGKKVLKEYLRDNGIEKIALWGGGNLGKSVLKSFEHHGIDVRFLIDRNKDCIDGTDVYSPGDEWPECDCVIITIASTDTEIEEVLNNKKVKYEYYYKLIRNIFDAGRS
ncbi:MAG: GNAT family N-acetyltransferase, partial [Butyrivibrio sp.]|nr:GNAT family N-acetyltransferase [Butyrivibrio sp.]